MMEILFQRLGGSVLRNEEFNGCDNQGNKMRERGKLGNANNFSFENGFEGFVMD
jgi:hypothetical protein